MFGRLRHKGIIPASPPTGPDPPSQPTSNTTSKRPRMNKTNSVPAGHFPVLKNEQQQEDSIYRDSTWVGTQPFFLRQSNEPRSKHRPRDEKPHIQFNGNTLLPLNQHPGDKGLCSYQYFFAPGNFHNIMDQSHPRSKLLSIHPGSCLIHRPANNCANPRQTA